MKKRATWLMSLVVLLVLMPSGADAGCTVELRARWTGIPPGSRGVIVLKGFKQKAQVRTKGGTWSPLLGAGRPAQRQVTFYPNGSFKDSHVWGNSGGWSVINSGSGIWRFTKNLRMGCKHERQYRFLAETYGHTGGALGGWMINFPGQSKFAPKNTTVIDFGDLGRFSWTYK
ncbi:hypothetical protein [Geopsychrobacter electrodiphilus]|uniref:hypothetical protein n=1 Tax=Geopsychrobacter electrodiphilus TaxID=225196 RepID=UPI0003823F43|nr:hypothetical protein [Geopsychrobacter electrodiphilus]